MATNWRYMPILKWKRGEQEALRFLTVDQWADLTPLIELQPIGAAPDAAAIRTAMPGYIDTLAAQIEKSVPEGKAIGIDTAFACSGYERQASLLLYICSQLRKKIQHPIIPVMRSSWLIGIPALSAPQLAVLSNSPEIILRVRTDSLQPEQVVPTLDELAKYVKRRRVHIILDQFSLVDKNPADCVTAVTPYVDIAASAVSASVTLAGGAFPMNLTGKKQGITDIPRTEWKIWEHFVATRRYSWLRYADFAVTNPMPMAEDIDGSKLSPSIAIRYASTDFWRLYKGRGFKSGARGELRALCQLLVSEAVYSGEPFSYGDRKYMQYSAGSEKNGIPWTWRRDATNHHIVFTSNAL